MPTFPLITFDILIKEIKNKRGINKLSIKFCREDALNKKSTTPEIIRKPKRINPKIHAHFFSLEMPSARAKYNIAIISGGNKGNIFRGLNNENAKIIAMTAKILRSLAKNLGELDKMLIFKSILFIK